LQSKRDGIGKQTRNKITAVRPPKKQNDTKYRNLEESDCKLEYKIGRTADTGEQRSVFAGGVWKRFPKRAFSYPSQSNGLISAERLGRSFL